MSVAGAAVLGLIGGFLFWRANKFTVHAAYVDEDCVVIDGKFGRRPDHVVLVVRANVSSEDEAGTEARLIAADGSPWKLSAVSGPGDVPGRPKGPGAELFFPIARRQVETGGLSVQFNDKRPVRLADPIEFRKAVRQTLPGKGYLAPAIMLKQ